MRSPTCLTDDFDTLHCGSVGKPTFNAYTDVPAGGCTGQKAIAWRLPVGIQLIPALVLGVGLFFMPFSPRWLVEVGRDEEARQTLSMLRNAPADSPHVRLEYLEIKAEVEIVRQIRATKAAGKTTMIGKLVQPYVELVSTKANFHRLAIGCLVMFYQQFIGCNVSRIPRVESHPGQMLRYRLLNRQLSTMLPPVSRYSVAQSVLFSPSESSSLCSAWSGSQHDVPSCYRSLRNHQHCKSG